MSNIKIGGLHSEALGEFKEHELDSDEFMQDINDREPYEAQLSDIPRMGVTDESIDSCGLRLAMESGIGMNGVVRDDNTLRMEMTRGGGTTCVVGNGKPRVYGILGASGSGRTTLVQALIDNLGLNREDIEVIGKTELPLLGEMMAASEPALDDRIVFQDPPYPPTKFERKKCYVVDLGENVTEEMCRMVRENLSMPIVSMEDPLESMVRKLAESVNENKAFLLPLNREEVGFTVDNNKTTPKIGRNAGKKSRKASRSINKQMKCGRGNPNRKSWFY